MPQFDTRPKGLLRIGVGEAPDGAVRVRAVDLRALGQQAAVARAEHPGAAVVVDIDVAIAEDARSARVTVADLNREPGDTLLYVGTPDGLVGLIADIHSLGIADGAVLLPMTGSGTLDLIYDRVLPKLSPTGPASSAIREARPA
jgi:alkanesulfonate monooxygenase SsuD/methylene tetrahydromethanopterin reductase-like flavin-dependent oxidoreductase (luciferase family)